jgi:hypothetical protein
MEETVIGEADGQKQEVIISKTFWESVKGYETYWNSLDNFLKRIN